MKEREDTIEELVSGILGLPSSNIRELADELTSLQLQKNASFISSQPQSAWFPDPLDAPADFNMENNFDIIGNLLSMYDIKDGIIKELIKRFAEKMLLPSEQVSEEIVRIMVVF